LTVRGVMMHRRVDSPWCTYDAPPMMHRRVNSPWCTYDAPPNSYSTQIFKGTVGYGFFSKVNEIKTIKKEQSPKLLMKFYKGVALSLPPPSLRKFINSSFHTPFHQISNFLHDITTFLQHF